jgi:hypothetical protein
MPTFNSETLEWIGKRTNTSSICKLPHIGAFAQGGDLRAGESTSIDFDM